MNAKSCLEELQNGYRMPKPEYVPHSFGEIMAKCWEKEPKRRPTFSQLKEMISNSLESSVSSYYLDLNAPYLKLNEEKVNASSKDCLDLVKMLDETETGL